MKTKEIRTLDKSMLNEKKVELKKELVKMNAQVAIGTALKNPGQVREIKKTIARIAAIQNEKTLQKKERIAMKNTKKNSEVDEKT